jgi:hypothetical protein
MDGASMRLPTTARKIFHPLSLDSKITKSKKEYLAASIAVGILTVGTAHAIYGLSRLAGKIHKKLQKESSIRSNVSNGNVNVKTVKPSTFDKLHIKIEGGETFDMNDFKIKIGGGKKFDMNDFKQIQKDPTALVTIQVILFATQT